MSHLRLRLILWLSAVLAIGAMVSPITARAQQFTKTAGGPNYLYAEELSDSVLQVDFSLLGYSFRGDAAYEDPDDWDVGPHFNPIIAAATIGNTQAIGRIFWLEPGFSMNDLPDAKFVGFDLSECLCSAVGPAISIVSDLTWAALQDSGGPEQDFDCILGAPGVLTICPLLYNGQSQTIPILDIPSNYTPTEADEPMIVQFTDLREGPVPEPQTWAMMLLGLGALGAALRLHRSRAAYGRKIHLRLSAKIAPPWRSVWPPVPNSKRMS